jgi:hypothetical protein
MKKRWMAGQGKMLQPIEWGNTPVLARLQALIPWSMATLFYLHCCHGPLPFSPQQTHFGR